MPFADKALPVKAAKPTLSKPSPPAGVKIETIETIHNYLWEMYEADVESVNEDELVKKTGYNRADSKGFRNAVKFVVNTQGYATKGNKKLSLTEAGIEYCHETFGSTKPTSNEEAAERFKADMIALWEKKIKAEALDKVWNILADGSSHSNETLFTAAGYKRADSKGYAVIMKWGKKLGLIEKSSGEVSFTDKVFPFGRP
ncbi:MAG: hypothetical protein SGARI_002780 [Bacillariaceae sp.]